MTDTVQTKLLSLPDFAERSNAFHQAALAYGKLLLEGGYDESKVADYLRGQIDFVAQLLRSSGDVVPRAGATLPTGDRACIAQNSRNMTHFQHLHLAFAVPAVPPADRDSSAAGPSCRRLSSS